MNKQTTIVAVDGPSASGKSTVSRRTAQAMGFIYVMMGALGKWRAYSMGRAEIADLKEYFIMAAVLAVFIVIMATYAAQVLA